MLPEGWVAHPTPTAMSAGMPPVMPPAAGELGAQPASRQRKSRKPNRRSAGAEGVMVNSRRLFGRGGEAATAGAVAAASSGLVPPTAADDSSPLGHEFGLAAAGGMGALAAGTLAVESDDRAVEGALGEQLPALGERIAQHINTLPERAAGACRPRAVATHAQRTAPRRTPSRRATQSSAWPSPVKSGGHSCTASLTTSHCVTSRRFPLRRDVRR